MDFNAAWLPSSGGSGKRSSELISSTSQIGTFSTVVTDALRFAREIVSQHPMRYLKYHGASTVLT
jgi:hypothetical protein